MAPSWTSGSVEISEGGYLHKNREAIPQQRMRSTKPLIPHPQCWPFIPSKDISQLFTVGFVITVICTWLLTLITLVINSDCWPKKQDTDSGWASWTRFTVKDWGEEWMKNERGQAMSGVNQGWQLLSSRQDEVWNWSTGDIQLFKWQHKEAKQKYKEALVFVPHY